MRLCSHFSVVGVVELYGTFVDLVQKLLDPGGGLMGKQFWVAQKTHRENESVKSTSKIVATLQATDPTFMQSFNASLQHEYRIYNAGLGLCRKQAAREGISIDTFSAARRQSPRDSPPHR